MDGCRAVVRNGYQPEREVLTGVGPLPVKVPKTRDRSGKGRCFRSVLVPPYLKKARRVEAVVPVDGSWGELRASRELGAACLPGGPAT